MSIDSRFSKDRFRTEVEIDPGARQLSDELAAAVLKQLHERVAAIIEEIVTHLNRHGHDLRLYYPAQPGDISYRDDRLNDGIYECDLRLGADIVVSVGFRDTIQVDDDGGDAQ